MADDRHYVMGDFYRICDRTGFKMRAKRTRMEWTGNIVRDQSWEPRQPQDFVQGVMDDQTVPYPRPRQVDSFQGPLGTTLTVAVVPNAVAPYMYFVESTVRMFIDDVVNIMQDNGEILRARIIDVPSQTQLQLDRTVEYTASVGNVVINITAESDPVFP